MDYAGPICLRNSHCLLNVRSYHVYTKALLLEFLFVKCSYSAACNLGIEAFLIEDNPCRKCEPEDSGSALSPKSFNCTLNVCPWEWR